MTANQSPLVSIIVPVYGTEAYLSACIDSICNQTYKNIQIVLVDDQSPDGCPEICDSYAEKDARIKVIHQSNTGVSGARNTGLRNADGDYVMFVDSDDELYPNAVDIMIHDIHEYGADIVWAPQRLINKNDSGANGQTAGEHIIFSDSDSLLLSLDGAYNINAVWGKIFKTTFIEGLIFEEGKNINEDGFFMFQCYIRKPVLVQHNVSVYKYNVREDSCSRQKFSDKYFAMLYFCNRKMELINTACPQYTESAYNMVVRTNLQFCRCYAGLTIKSIKIRIKNAQKRFANCISIINLLMNITENWLGL